MIPKAERLAKVTHGLISIHHQTPEELQARRAEFKRKRARATEDLELIIMYGYEDDPEINADINAAIAGLRKELARLKIQMDRGLTPRTEVVVKIPLPNQVNSPRRSLRKLGQAVGKIIRLETRVEDSGALRKYTEEIVSLPGLERELERLPAKGHEASAIDLEDDIDISRQTIGLGISASTGFAFLDVPIGPQVKHQIYPRPRVSHDSGQRELLVKSQSQQTSQTIG